MKTIVFGWLLNIINSLPIKLLRSWLPVLIFLIFIIPTSTHGAEKHTTPIKGNGVNESEATHNLQPPYSTGTDSAASISELEKKLSLSESQRVAQSQVFDRKLSSAIVLASLLGVFGVISFILFKKFKKQKEQLAHANAEVKRVNEHLEDLVYKRTSQLLETNKELDTFLYKSSHDLRRPLTTIVGLSNIAHMTLSKESHELFERASHTAQQMDKMLKKLIAVNNIHHPSIYSPIHFEKQVQKSIQQFEDIIADRKVLVDTAVDPNLSYTSYPEIIEIILLNLLENAIWFSTCDQIHGSPKVWLHISQANNHISILVKDNGPGVEDKIKNSIWDMFYVGHEKSNGNGLGLYLTKKAVKVLDGTVNLKSADLLTTFEVMLPVNAS